MLYEITKEPKGLLNLPEGYHSVINSTSNSVYLKPHKSLPLTISNEVTKIKDKNTSIDDKYKQVFHKYHHGVTPHERTGFEEIIRLAPGVTYSTETKNLHISKIIENEIPFWTDQNKDMVEEFYEVLTETLENSDADFILFSGGIDSLILALLDPHKRPLLHFNNDELQKTMAIELSEELQRSLRIIDPLEMGFHELKDAFKLRRYSLGHYLPWNNATTFDERLQNTKVISGQHADTLLMVDTFAPGLNLHGPYWYAKMLLTIKERSPYCRKIKNPESLKRNLFKSIDGFDEHIPLGSDGFTSSHGIQNMTAHAVLNSEQSKNLPFVALCKALKNFRFCINANRIYTDAKNYNGYNRDLIYYNRRVKRLIY